MLKVVCSTVLFTILVGVGSASALCTNADLNGVWAIETTKPNPEAVLAQVTFDGVGNLAVSVTANSGTLQTASGTGTYTAAKNCIVSVTINFTGGGTANFNFVLHQAKQAVEVIATKSGMIEHGFGYTRGTLVCGFTGKKETFVSNLSGVVPGTGATAGVGEIILDGSGHIIAGSTITWSVAGTINTAPVTGTYTENADCTGTATITPSGFPTSHYDFMIVNARRTILILQTDSNTVVAGTMQK